MLKCDACSKEVSESEMQVTSGREVASKTRAGFVPNGIAGGVISAFGKSKADIWRDTVERNATAEWGFCGDCYAQLTAFASPPAQAKPWRGLLASGIIVMAVGLVGGGATLLNPADRAKAGTELPGVILVSTLMILAGLALVLGAWQRRRRRA